MILLLAALPLTGCDEFLGSDGDGDEVDGALYTMNNAASANFVIALSRDDDGRLTRASTVSSGGQFPVSLAARGENLFLRASAFVRESTFVLLSAIT